MDLSLLKDEHFDEALICDLACIYIVHIGNVQQKVELLSKERVFSQILLQSLDVGQPESQRQQGVICKDNMSDVKRYFHFHQLCRAFCRYNTLMYPPGKQPLRIVLNLLNNPTSSNPGSIITSNVSLNRLLYALVSYFVK